MQINPYEFKCMIFEIYSAGYIDAFNNESDGVGDLKTSFDAYYKQFERMIDNDKI